MPPLHWNQLLTGLRPRLLRGNIHQIDVQVLGKVEVGPYDQLLSFVRTSDLYRLPVNVHHIVNGEHLDGTGWIYLTAPCVVLGRDLHQQYHGRFNEVLPEYHGRDVVDPFSIDERLALYHDMFVVQTGWKELWTIAARILSGKITVLPPTADP
jgi:hypothetical protein